MVTDKYKALIDRFPLVPIKSDRHLDEAHAVAQSLILQGSDIASDETDYLEVLLDEISKYESKHHALDFENLAPMSLFSLL